MPKKTTERPDGLTKGGVEQRLVCFEEKGKKIIIGRGHRPQCLIRQCFYPASALKLGSLLPACLKAVLLHSRDEAVHRADSQEDTRRRVIPTSLTVTEDCLWREGGSSTTWGVRFVKKERDVLQVKRLGQIKNCKVDAPKKEQYNIKKSL